MQSSHAHELLVTGLKNAHAMERQALSILQPQVERLSHYPDMEARLANHVGETKGQIERLEAVLEQLGESPSSLKDAALSFAGTMAAMGHTVAPDEVLKNSFANLAFENYEIGAYKSLLALAKAAGATQAVPLLTHTLEEEQAMANWIDAHVAPTTERYLALRDAGETAKR